MKASSKMDDAIMPECYVDTNLIETLVPPVRKGNQHGYNHQKGCATVTTKMQKNFADRFALGIIDKDKQAVDYLKEFDVVVNKGSLILHKHKDPVKHHYIIQINPAIEQFILNAAAELGISLKDYSLPNDLEQLKKATKTKTSKDDADFKRLFRALKDGKASDIVRLSNWVGHLKKNNYQADLDVLASF